MVAKLVEYDEKKCDTKMMGEVEVSFKVDDDGVDVAEIQLSDEESIIMKVSELRMAIKEYDDLEFE